MRLLIVLIICAFNASATASPIDRSEVNASLNNVKSLTLTYKGKEGLWFPLDSSAIILDVVEKKLPKAFDLIDDQDRQIFSLRSAVESYKTSNKSYVELAEYNRQMFDTAMKHLPNMDPPVLSWYEQPKASFIFGVITGGVVIFAATYAAAELIGNTGGQ